MPTSATPDHSPMVIQLNPNHIAASAELGTRTRILRYIHDHPGSHLRGLARELKLGMGNLQYHVHILERSGLLSSSREGLRKFFYTRETFQESSHSLINSLSQETPREILTFLTLKGSSTQHEICLKVERKQSTVSWHLDRLRKAGLIEVSEAQGGGLRPIRYRVNENVRKKLAVFMESYHPSIWTRWSERMNEIVESISEGFGTQSDSLIQDRPSGASH